MDKDEWGKNSGVREMRRVFSGMEAAVDQILQELAISPYDRRIRGWLELTLPKFEKAWHIGRQMGLRLDENEVSLVYAHCLAKVIASTGINIPEGLLPAEDKIQKLVSEVFE